MPSGARGLIFPGVPPRASRFLLPIIYLGFISLGLPDGTLGVAWPQMHQSLQLPIGLAGTLMLVVTVLSGLSSFSSGAILRRCQTGPVVLVSCTLTGSALLLISQAQNLGWLLLAAAPLGFGAGAVDTGLNSYVARHYSGRHMNWLHACWGIGATCGPLLMTNALSTRFGWRGGYATIAGIQLGLALIFLLTLRLWATQPAIPTTAGAPAAGQSRGGTLPANSAAGWLSAVVFVLYVAAELTAGLWAGTILVETRGLSVATAGLCTTVYYGAITGGRILVGFFVDRWGNRRLVTLGLGLALPGALLFTQAASPGWAAGALLLLGLGFAPIYPCLMHEVPRRFAPEAVLTVIGRQSGASYVGGAIFPAAAGWLAMQTSLACIPWLVVVGIGLMALTIHRLNRLT